MQVVRREVHFCSSKHKSKGRNRELANRRFQRDQPFPRREYRHRQQPGGADVA